MPSYSVMQPLTLRQIPAKGPRAEGEPDVHGAYRAGRPRRRHETPRVAFSIAIAVAMMVYAVAPCASQRCEPWDGNPPVCGNYGLRIGDPVYIYPGSSLAYQVERLNYWLNSVSTNLNTPPARPCIPPSLRSLCLTWARPCVELPDGRAMPVEPCLDVFDWSRELCYPLVANSPNEVYFGLGTYQPPGASLPMQRNWTDPDAGPAGAPFYQEDAGYDVLVVNGTEAFNFSIPCNDGGGRITNVSLSTCNAPLVSVGSGCAYPCELPPLTGGQYKSLEIVYGIFGLLGTILCGSMLLAALINPILRGFPSCMYTFLYFWGLVTSISFAYPAITGWRYKKIWCAGGEYAVMSVTVTVPLSDGSVSQYGSDLAGYTSGQWECGMTGFMTYVGLVNMLQVSTHILIYQAVTLVVKRLWGDKFDMPRKWLSPAFNIGLLCVTSALTALAGVGLWGGGVVLFSVGSPFCFINPEEVGIQSSMWLFPVLTMLICSMVTTGCICVVLAYQVAFFGPRSEQARTTFSWIAITLVHAMLLVVMYVGVTYWSFFLLTQHDSVIEHVNDYLNCSLNPFSSACNGSDSVEGDQPQIMFSGVQAAIVAPVLCSVQLWKPKFWRAMWVLCARLASLRFNGCGATARSLLIVLANSDTSRMTAITGNTMSMQDDSVANGVDDDDDDDMDDVGITEDSSNSGDTIE